MVANTSQINDRMLIDMAIFGAFMIPAGVLIQAFIPTYPLTGLGISILPMGAFLMIYGTSFHYRIREENINFPGKRTFFSAIVMGIGIILTLVPVLRPSLFLIMELPGPLIFAYGLVMIMLQLQSKYSTSSRLLVILSLLLLAAGLLIPSLLNLFRNSGFLSLAITPAVAGLYLLFVPMSRKIFASWKSHGYLQ